MRNPEAAPSLDGEQNQGKEEVKFDPEKHTKIPEEENGGFVKKEAYERFTEASKLAEIARIMGQEKNIGAVDILHQETIKTRENAKKDFEQAISDTKVAYEEFNRLNRTNPEDLETREEGRKAYDRFVELAAKEHDLIKSMPEELRRDKDFMLELIKMESGAIHDALPEFQQDESFLLEAIRVNPVVFIILSRSEGLYSQFMNKEFVLKAVKQDPGIYEYVAKYSKLSGDLDILLEAIKGDSTQIKYAPEEIKEKLMR